MAWGFGAVDGKASTDKIKTGITRNGIKRSYSIWYMWRDVPPDGYGYILSKRASNYSEMFGYNVAAQMRISYTRQFAGGNLGVSWYGGVTSLVPYHALVTFDASSGSNRPILYLNGKITGVADNGSDQTGAAYADTAPYYIGNRAEGDRGWYGWVGEVAAWDLIWGAAEARFLSQGNSALWIPEGLHFCTSMGGPDPGPPVDLGPLHAPLAPSGGRQVWAPQLVYPPRRRTSRAALEAGAAFKPWFADGLSAYY